jgi:hypothetical protein
MMQIDLFAIEPEPEPEIEYDTPNEHGVYCNPCKIHEVSKKSETLAIRVYLMQNGQYHATPDYMSSTSGFSTPCTINDHNIGYEDERNAAFRCLERIPKERISWGLRHDMFAEINQGRMLI